MDRFSLCLRKAACGLMSPKIRLSGVAFGASQNTVVWHQQDKKEESKYKVKESDLDMRSQHRAEDNEQQNENPESCLSLISRDNGKQRYAQAESVTVVDFVYMDFQLRQLLPPPHRARHDGQP